MLLDLAIKTTFIRAGKAWQSGAAQPKRMSLSTADHFKGIICWIYAFKRTYAVEPGLYFTGEKYDREAPLLVTSNYLLSALLVYKKIKDLNVRLLVIDTDGINVWCSAGKGRFGNAEILKQLSRYEKELLTGEKCIKLVIPKFGMSGVNLRGLREAGIQPVIGPLYSTDIPAYLANPPLKDRDRDRVIFGIGMRAFAWLPGLVQYVSSFTAAAIVLALLGFKTSIFMLIALPAILGTAYPALFPYLPGKRFAIKGLWLGAGVSVILAAAFHFAGGAQPIRISVYTLFTIATSLFIGLSFTGNSAVSNYSRVRKEIAAFLPFNVLLYIACLALSFIKG